VSETTILEVQEATILVAEKRMLNVGDILPAPAIFLLHPTNNVKYQI